MVLLTVGALTLIATVVFIGVDAYEIYQSHQDAGETIDALGALSESLDDFVLDLSNVLQDFVSALEDFAAAIMQYMDIWGVVILSCVAVVGVISFFNLFLLARGNRR